MNSAPCAKLTMRMMPKISVSPQAMKNSTAACESALRLWAKMKPAKFIWMAGQACGVPPPRAERGGEGNRETSPRRLISRGQAVRGDRLARIDFHDLRN